MTALRKPDESPREQRPGRWERATDAGYEPHHDDAAPLAAHLKLAADDPWMKALEESRARVIAFGNPAMCSVCRMGVDLDWSADVCEHNVVVCESCTFVDGCAECAEGSDW